VRGGSEVDGTADAACQGHAAIRHRQSESGSIGTHWIYIDANSRLHDLLGLDSVMVNSFHHQAVKDPGTGVRVVARSADGVVEAWEWDAPQRTGSSKRGSLQHSGSSRRSSNICVQFHPEIFVKSGDATFLPLFQDLIDRAR
jgi:putative glutamine amidotransferase